MKKIIVLFMLVLMLFSLTGCGSNDRNGGAKEVKDVTMLLSGIGGDISVIKTLGDLPEPQAVGDLQFYDTKGTEGYFSGFNLGIGLSDDNKTVKQIYLEPVEKDVKANGFIIGCSVEETNGLFGKGELSSEEQDGKINTFIIYKDGTYRMKCTVQDNKIAAVLFEKSQGTDESAAEKTGESVEQNGKKNDSESSMKEIINGKEVDFGQNDVVVIRDYKGKYLSKLNSMEFEWNGGSKTICFAVFGSIVDVYLNFGWENSEGFSELLVNDISDTLITFKNVKLEKGTIANISFRDSNGKAYSMSFGTEDEGLITIKDSGKNSKEVEPGHTLKATYEYDGYKFLIERDKTEKVASIYKNYLYLKKGNQEKVLLAESVDKGNDWVNSVGGILNPTLSNDKTKVYYETDNSFTRTNGAGANNHRARVIDLNTHEDNYLNEGAIERLLSDDFYQPYQNYLILQTYTKNNDGKVVPYYYVVDPQGEEISRIGESLELYGMDIVDQIDAGLIK